MNNIIEKALKVWGMENARYKLIAARENHVFRIDTEKKSFAMRMHREGYRTNDELWSELQWMHAVADNGLLVPAPIKSVSGEYLNTIDEIQVDVLTWLTGNPMGKSKQALLSPNRTELFYNLGSEMARLHSASDNWPRPHGFIRCSWDRDGLVGDAPVWGRFWDNPSLSSEDRSLFKLVRRQANEMLKEVEDSQDYGLIHADLVRENIMIDGTQLQFIDFDDSGFGFRLFELATTLLANRYEQDYPTLRIALIHGYRSQRAINTDFLDLFIVLRAMTYVGWIMTRMDEEGSKIRNQRFVDASRFLAIQFIAAHQ